MNRKRLTMYDFGKKIMSDFDSFYYKPLNIKPKYLHLHNEKAEIYSLTFSWFWNDYNGYGRIDYDSQTNEICNQFGECHSEMTVHSDSKRKAQKHVSPLYNDASLVPLLNFILDSTNLNSEQLN